MKIIEFAQSIGLSWRNGSIRVSSGQPVKFPSLYKRYLDELGDGDVPATKSDFQTTIVDTLKTESEAARKCAIENNPFDTVTSSDDLVEQAIKFNDFYICAKGEKITQKGLHAGLETLETAVLHHNNHYRDASMGEDGKLIRMVWGAEAVRIALKFMLDKKEQESRLKLREDLVFDETCVGYTDDVLKGLLSSFKALGEMDLNMAVLKQWLWQTKRYVFGKKVPSPLMVNLLGKVQETGKTLLVRRIADSMKDFFAECTLAQVIDSREAERWTGNYIVLFDELNLGNLDPKEFGQMMATFKYMLTADEINHRVMRTTKQSRSDRTFSPISTSNETMVNIIYDPTGMRRFFEIEMECGVDQGRIDNIFAVDFNLLWQGIDEEKEKGFISSGCDMYKKMLDVQNSYKRKESIDWALQYIDYGTLPVMVSEYTEIYNTTKEIKNVKELAKKLEVPGLTVHTVLSIRKTIAEWVKEEMGIDQIKWVPQGARFIHALEIRGYWVHDAHGNDPRIICKLAETTSDDGVGI